MSAENSASSGSVFVSYAHTDQRWADELATFLKPWLSDRRLRLWDDRQIAPGQNWQNEIERALDQALVSVLLVTPNLLASEFVVTRELPRIVERAEQDKTRLMWIAAEYAAFEATPLISYQAVNDPRQPLAALPKPERQRVLTEIAKRIADAATLGTLASSLNIVDETYEPLEALAEGREEVAGRRFGVVAHYSPERQQEITFTGYQSIRYEDLAKLAPDDHEFVQDLEDSLKKNYSRWRIVRAEIGTAGGALDKEAEDQLRRLARLMCKDLADILEFLRRIYHYDLEDHYGRYRYLCSQLGGP